MAILTFVGVWNNLLLPLFAAAILWLYFFTRRSAAALPAVPSEPGIPDVRIYLEDGSFSQTDADVVIATGRSRGATLPVAQSLGIEAGYMVCSNGGVTLRLDPALEDGYEVTDCRTFDPRSVLSQLRSRLPELKVVLEHVTTAEGVLCVTGDAACMMENLQLPTPPGTHIGTAISLASLKKISDLSDRVLMNHDPELGRFQSAGFPATPDVHVP